MAKLAQKTLRAFGGGTLPYILLFLFVDRPVEVRLHLHFSEGRVHRMEERISGPAWSPAGKIALALTLLAGLIGIPSSGGKNRPWTIMPFSVCLSCAVAIIIGEELKIVPALYRPVMLFDHNLYGLHFSPTNGN